jgi:hypothetical protein
MLCRALSTSSAIAWALLVTLQLFYVVKQADTRDVLTGLQNGAAQPRRAAHSEHNRLAIVQIALSYLWVSTSMLRRTDLCPRDVYR